MSEFKLCKNGHYYQQSLVECPYCPKPLSQPPVRQADITQFTSEPELKSVEKTSSMSESTNQPTSSQPGNLAKTQIYTGEETSAGQPLPKAAPRKLVGWLVSFTVDPNGADFRLYEGRNSVGSDSANDVVVRNDSAISGKHLTILYRMGGFKFKDELSTNGTYVNNAFTEEGDLKDGDTIRVGNTTFKFRTVA